ncbi:MAG: Hsp20/alpha crystallin family protein [Pseudomonadales bacterium]|nr:Hsp20/alpha crystallin family protein [Pseudomonadales bacterium]
MSQFLYSPLSRLSTLQREPNQSLNKRDHYDWTPQVDIQELEKNYIVLVDIPGIEDKDIDITLDKNVLTIKGKRTSTLDHNVEIKRQERVVGELFRQFTLPDTVDGEHISASSKLGVLSIDIPKVKVAKPLSIAIAS